MLIALVSLKGFKDIFKGFNPWTIVTLSLITLTLVLASFSMSVSGSGLIIGFTGRWIAEIILLAAVWWVMARYFSAEERQEWLWETWRFVKQIIPLLLAGVFVASIARGLIPANWIQTIAGRNTLWANLAGCYLACLCISQRL